MRRPRAVRPVVWLAVVAALTTMAAECVPEPPAPNVPPQSPFLCLTEAEGFGQPIVDNQDHRGTPVYPEVDGVVDRNQAPVGWSERCQVMPRYEYWYRTTANTFTKLPTGATALPADIALINKNTLIGASDMTMAAGTHIPYLMRYEIGTLPEHRFFYRIMMLVSWEEYLNRDSVEPGTHWNQRLVYQFEGGVAIGHSQGRFEDNATDIHVTMRRGFAVVKSTGTRTYTHYNLALGGRTALELKQLFVDRHGEPRYTVGTGGSGGSIQQYLYGQNHPGLLDGAIPNNSYPDMVSQTTHTGDCEPLAHYMDQLDGSNPRWADWGNRKIVQGMYSSNSPRNTTCISGWRNWSMLNPTLGFPWGLGDVLTPYLGPMAAKQAAGQPIYPDDFPDLGRLFRTHEDPAQRVQWGHWNDAREVYGTNQHTGFANITWDNVGVQYGLRAVAQGQITPDEFLNLNARIGSWKEPADHVLESCLRVRNALDTSAEALAQFVGMCAPGPQDHYSARNLWFSTNPNVPAPRRSADVEGIRGAYEHGHVFTGSMPRTIPIIDTRPYRDHNFNMHIADQSFTARERIRREEGDAAHHVIWMTDTRPGGGVGPVLSVDAFVVMDQWLAAIEAHPTHDVVASKPPLAVDHCLAMGGSLIAAGDGVWSGAVELIETGANVWGPAPSQVNGVPVGACSAHFPLNSTSRVVAGAPVTGDVFKCHTKPVGRAISDGDYGTWNPTPTEVARLEGIFPNGVCDYSKPSVGDPSTASYVARYTPAVCGQLRNIATAVGVPVEDVIKAGVNGFVGLAESGQASPVPSAPTNRDGCEITVTWDVEDAERIRMGAEAWGVDVDELHHGGGALVIAIIIQAILQGGG